MSSNKAELIFMKWKAELAEMDRSKPAVEGNFELLFDQMANAKVKLDDALPFLEKASKAHYPNDFMIKKTYQKIKKFGRSETLVEFEHSWKEFIDDAAKRTFFCFYDIEGATTPKQTINGMSRSEYAKLQRYADSHETIDWEAIIRERDEPVISLETEPEIDIDLEKVDIDIDLGEL